MSILQSSQFLANSNEIESVIKGLNDNITASRRNTGSVLKAYETERSRKVIKNFRSQQNRAKYSKKISDGLGRIHVFNTNKPGEAREGKRVMVQK